MQALAGRHLGDDRLARGPDSQPLGELLAAGSIAMLPLLVIFVLLQRHFINGILAGSVKG